LLYIRTIRKVTDQETATDMENPWFYQEKIYKCRFFFDFVDLYSMGCSIIYINAGYTWIYYLDVENPYTPL
jgi:hypothetical protein